MRQRRRYKRTKIQSMAIITVVGNGSVLGPFEGLIWSIGFGGVGVRSRQAVGINSQVEAILTLTDSSGNIRREAVQGTVIWEAHRSSYFIFGMQFDGINRDDHPVLINFLEAQKREFENLHIHEASLEISTPG